MKHFPVYMAVAGRKIALVGGGAAALAKLRLLLKTEARIAVFASLADAEIHDWAANGKLTLHKRALGVDDLQDATLVYAASEDTVQDAEVARLAEAAKVPVNIVDNLAQSDFITPAIVDRDPVTIAIGTEGAAPVLARALKRDLEERLSPRLGLLARVGQRFRAAAEALPFGHRRRDFWSDYFLGTGPRLAQEHDAEHALNDLLAQHLQADSKAGHLAFVGAGPGDPELLTLKARNALDSADVVIHDGLVTAEILDLARREATLVNVAKQGFGPSTAQKDINDLLVSHAKQGAQIVRLKGGDATVFGRLDEEIEAVQAVGISWHIVPGITAASAAVAAIGQSLTSRGRNASVRILTGHDMQGFADHDWHALARSNQVAAIYMGKKAARFIQGRLLMHGANPDTPVTFVENASLHNQRVVSTSLKTLPADLADAALSGPALALLGLTPRAASATFFTHREQEFA